MHFSFLALGDSYTIGEGVPVAERWPLQLVAQLRAASIDIDDPKIVATTGWTTDELAAAMDVDVFDPPYALVTLLIGVNNQYRGRPLDEYRAQFIGLLQRAVELAGSRAAHVVVVSIPDWGMTRFARDEGRDPRAVGVQIDLFNAEARVEVERVGARWVDITGISRAPEGRDELVTDGLHPSGQQYARWVGAILPAARSVLAQS